MEDEEQKTNEHHLSVDRLHLFQFRIRNYLFLDSEVTGREWFLFSDYYGFRSVKRKLLSQHMDIGMHG